MTILAYFAELRRATTDARRRLGDKNIATNVRAGKYSVVRLTWVKRKCTETYLATGLSLDEAVAFLDAMQPSPSEQCRAS